MAVEEGPSPPQPPPQQDGGILIVLGMPEGAEFGIDLKSYQVGPNFRGIAGVPMGLHLVTAGTGQGLRQGFFLRFSRPREVVVKSWDPREEELVEEGTGLPEGSMDSLLQALARGELNKQLGAYPEAEQGKLWRNLTNCVTEEVLALCGLKLEARVVPGDWEEEKLPRGRPGADAAASAVVPYFPGVGRSALFTDVAGEKRPAHREMTPAELTEYHLDKSERLEVLLRDVYAPAAAAAKAQQAAPWRLLLGEHQLAFVLFLNLYAMAGLKHWKEMTALLCGCRKGLGVHREFYEAFLRVLFTQVKTIPEDFFVDELTTGRAPDGSPSVGTAGGGFFLEPCLRSLLRNVRDCEPPSSLSPEFREYVDRFAALMEKRFQGLDLGRRGKPHGKREVLEEEDEEAEDEEDDEGGPVVVPWEEVEAAMARATLEEGSHVVISEPLGTIEE